MKLETLVTNWQSYFPANKIKSLQVLVNLNSQTKKANIQYPFGSQYNNKSGGGRGSRKYQKVVNLQDRT